VRLLSISSQNGPWNFRNRTQETRLGRHIELRLLQGSVNFLFMVAATLDLATLELASKSARQ
jgi:hypothetical protein